MPDLDFGDDAFCPIQAKAQETLCVFPSILTQIGRKGDSPKQDEGVAAYPNTWGRKGFDGDCEIW